jgi:hypothetical protein
MRAPGRRGSRTASTPTEVGRERVWDAVLSFLSPSALEESESHPMAGLPDPPRCAHRFSQPLDALLPPRPARVCFTPITLMGFPLFRGFPPLEAARLSARRPLLVSGRSHHLQGFDPPADPCLHQVPVKAPGSRSSLELHPLQGILPTCDGARVERVLPSCGSGSTLLRTVVSDPPLQGLIRQVDRLASFECCQPS